MSLLNKITKILFGSAIATLPLQLSFFAYQTEWGRGFINPYTSIAFSITDLFLLAAGITFFIALKLKKKPVKVGHRYFFTLFLATTLILLTSIGLSPFNDPAFHFMLTMKLFSVILFYLLIVNKALRPKEVLKIFIVTMSAQALLAILQVIGQGSLGLYVLGEPHLSDTAAHIARFTICDFTLIRGYGTFSHPNVLGGFLVVSLLCSLLFSPHLKHERLALILIQFTGLFATFSRSSMLALVVASVIIGLWYIKKLQGVKNKIIPITLISFFSLEFIFVAFSRGLNLLKDPALLERIEGYRVAWRMFEAHPMGVGFSHYTLFMDQVANQTLLPWEYQPVHNIFILLVNELGWILSGLACLVVLLAVRKFYQRRNKLLTHQRLFKKRILFVIVVAFIVIGTFDHYLVTLDQGRFLVIMIFGIISTFSKNPRHVLPIKTGESLNKILADLK